MAKEQEMGSKVWRTKKFLERGTKWNLSLATIHAFKHQFSLFNPNNPSPAQG